MSNCQYFIPPDLSTTHQQLQKILTKSQHNFLKPTSNLQLQAFNWLKPILQQYHRIHFDWGCGTGMSSLILAKRNPAHLIVGVDQSLYRLRKNPWFLQHKQHPTLSHHDNCILIQANIVDLALMLHQHNITSNKNSMSNPEKERGKWQFSQSFFYPNPWPKSKHLRRRWPTHPIFPILLALTPEIEMRCNWQSYAEQWLYCCQHLQPQSAHQLHELSPGAPISLFEKKYFEHGLACYQVISQKNRH